MSDRAALRRLWVLMATVFVDMLGALIVLPLLPFYATHLGADATLIGLLVAAYFFAQLVTAPIWGRLSDRYGRRPVILVGLLAAAVAYVLFGLADSVSVLFVMRLVQGAGGGMTGVAQAYVSDTVAVEDRAKALGWLSAATSAGVMIGPALSALTTAWGPSAPGFVAAALCLLNAAFAWRWLPESATHRHEPHHEPRRRLRTVLAEVLRRPASPASLLIWIYTAGMMAFFALNGVLALYLAHRFAVTERNVGWFYTYVGAISVVMRSLVLGPVVQRLGEVRTMRVGAAALVLGLALLPLPGRILGFALVVLLIPIGTALLFPATSSLVSRVAPRREVGQVLGLQQSFGSVARMAGPAWSGAAFQHLSVSAPFWLASGLMALAGVFALRLHRSAVAPRAAAPPATPPAAAALPIEPE